MVSTRPSPLTITNFVIQSHFEIVINTFVFSDILKRLDKFELKELERIRKKKVSKIHQPNCLAGISNLKCIWTAEYSSHIRHDLWSLFFFFFSLPLPLMDSRIRGDRLRRASFLARTSNLKFPSKVLRIEKISASSLIQRLNSLSNSLWIPLQIHFRFPPVIHQWDKNKWYTSESY